MNFLKTFLASLLAFITAHVLLIVAVVLFVAVVGIIGSSGTSVGHGSVLRIDFSNGVTDGPETALFSSRYTINNSNSILQVLSAIDHAADDSKIDGVFIDLRGGSISMANLEEVRGALERFRERSGKPITAYADSYSQGAYYLASVADKLYVHPEGAIAWRGLASQVMFYAGLLDKLGVEIEVLRHGEFKSAVEPFIFEEMSPENRLQMETLLESIWRAMREQVAGSRRIDPRLLEEYAAQLAVESSADAVRLGLADSMAYRDRVVENMGEMVDLHDYINSMTSHGTMMGDKIAVVYVDGDIIDGASVGGSAGSSTIAERLKDVREDDDVKGVVVRINSPGGSALAADVMWREMELLREEKPVVVSMGAMAASGGYYVACPADMILTDRTTITGSIGVFGLIPNVEGTLRDKLGITVDTALSEPHADMGSIVRPVDSLERSFFMRGIERVYNTFVSHVADGRNMSTTVVDSLGGGRVWSGVDAVRVGLTDGIGGLTDAIEICAERAGVADNYHIVEAIDGDDMFSAMVRSLAGTETRVPTPEEEMYAKYLSIVNLLKQSNIQARMPYEIAINGEL